MKLLDFIVAEDIRHEMGNKHSIIGIYNEVIGLQSKSITTWPIPFRFGVFIRLKTVEHDNTANKFTLNIVYDNNIIATMNGNVTPDKAINIISLPLVLSTFPLPGYGEITFNFEIFNDKKSLYSDSQVLEIVGPNQKN